MSTLRILIAEDETIVARDIALKLNKMGWNVAGSVSRGEDVLAVIGDGLPDLVLMDIHLRGQIDGIEAANLLHKHYDIPVVFVTAHTDSETVERAKLSEPFGYIIKPIEAQELYTTIQIAIYKHTAEKERRRQLQRLTAMRAIDQAILLNHDLSQTIQQALQQITTHLGVDAAAVLLVNPHSQTLAYFAKHGDAIPPYSHQPIRFGEGLAGKTASTRQRLCFPDLKNIEQSLDVVNAIKKGVCSYLALPMICKGELRGVLEIFHRQELRFDEEWLDFLESLTDQVAIAVDNASILEELKASNLNLIQAYNTTIEGWSKALELRDIETRGHSERVTKLTLRLSLVLGSHTNRLEDIRRGALLHDIGKMGIPDSILLKPGPLTPEEWEIMRRHPVYAAQMLSPIPFLRPAIDIPLYHHEKWDGSGYPEGLDGDRIPLAARIFAVVDVWDALCYDRPYNSAWPKAQVIEFIRQQSGKHFDPIVVQAFLRLIEAGDSLSICSP